MEEQETLYRLCPCCGHVTLSNSFCPECGYKFTGEERMLNQEEKDTLQPEEVLPSPEFPIKRERIEPAKGMLEPFDIRTLQDYKDVCPGMNGLGAIYICGECGYQYVNTGYGCPLCAARKMEEKEKNLK